MSASSAGAKRYTVFDNAICPQVFHQQLLHTLNWPLDLREHRELFLGIDALQLLVKVLICHI